MQTCYNTDVLFAMSSCKPCAERITSPIKKHPLDSKGGMQCENQGLSRGSAKLRFDNLLQNVILASYAVRKDCGIEG